MYYKVESKISTTLVL